MNIFTRFINARRGRSFLLVLLLALAMPQLVSAQETLTVYGNETSNSNVVPVYGYYIQSFYTKCEFVIPAEQLTAMNNGMISKMTFHLKTPASSGWYGTTFQVFLNEVASTSISSYYGTTGASIIYEGTLDGNQSTMDVVFSTPYAYSGGNLLVGFYSTEKGYSSSQAYFWGETVSGACVAGYNYSNLGSVTASQKNFIPKTTFTYTIDNCPTPKDLAATNVTNNSATLSWTQSGGVDHWDVFFTDNPNYEPKSYTHPQFANIDANPFELTGLEAGLTYYVYVRANCSSEVGDWAGPCSFLVADRLTLNDGLVTNQYVPLAGNFVSYNNTYGAFILPATDLQALTNAEIRQLTFYTDYPDNISWGGLTYELKLQESELTELTTSTSFNNVERSYYGSISVVDNKVTLTLDEPYVYGGGNLVISYTTFKPSTVTNGTAYWLGVSTGYSSSRYRYYSSSSYSSNTQDVQSFLPKTTITYVFPKCVKPANFVATATTTSATLSWTALDAEQTEWEIQYRKADETGYTSVQGTITNPHTLQGLEASHGYVARVRAVCGNDSYSDWAETRFNTDCSPITLPYSYGFEDVEIHDFPSCWSRIAFESNYVYPTVWNASWSNTGNGCLTLYCDDPESSVIAILPEIPVDAGHPMSDNELVFYAAAYYEQTFCQVGVMTDPTAPSSFELVEQVDVNEGLESGGHYRRFRVSFANYTGNGTYIAIRKVKDPGSFVESLLIDDIEVRHIPDCLEPSNLTVNAVTSSTATLQWTAGGVETSWQVQYKLSDDEWSETYQTANHNSFTLEGLTPGTNYQVSVRAACSASETSDWTDYESFITSNNVPYYEGFGSVYFSDMGWDDASGASMDAVLAGTASLVEGSSLWQRGWNSFTDTDNEMTYLNDYLIHIYNNMSDQYDWIITPYIELGEGYQLSFDLGLDYNHSATSGLDDNRFAVLITQDDGATWNLLALWDNDGTQGRYYYNLPLTPTEVTVSIPNTYNNKTVRFAFYSESVVYNSGTNHLYLDNVNISKILRPDRIAAANITANSASIDWTSHGETSWTLQYRIGETGDWTTVNNITAHPYNLTGLVGPNYYQVRVKAHNAAGSSEWSTTALFATECATINLGPDETYEQHFESQSCPACWETVNYSGAGSWYFNYGFEYDEQGNLVNGACAYCNSGTTSSELVMPEIEVTPGLCVTFHHNKTIGSKNRIRAYVTLSSTESFFLWDSDTDDLSAGVTTVSLNDFVGYTATVKFAFNAEASGYFYIYDVKLHNMNTFSKQTANGYWNETANWSKGAIPAANESATVADTALIPTGYLAQANEVFITPKGSLTIADGAQLKHNNQGVTATVQKSITPYSIAQTNGEDKANGWYLIASPMRNAEEPTASMFANEYDLYRFNQSAGKEWENYLQYFYLSPYFKLYNGQGYLYANSGDGVNSTVTIDINGQLRPSNENVEVPLTYDVSAPCAGFNLIGNPFACNAYLTTARDFYVMNANGDDLVINTSQNGVIAPMQGLFVQAADANDNAVTFTTTPPTTQNHNGALCLNLSQVSTNRTEATVIDRARVRFGEGPSLNKFSMKSDGARMYIPQGRQDYAVAYANQQGEVPVNFKAAENGSYTLTVNPEEVEMRYLHLIDNRTGADVDLLANPSYTFSAKTTDYASRFKLVFAADGNSLDNQDVFAFISNGEIRLLVETRPDATLQVIDMMGRIIVERRDGACTVSTDDMTPGVYVLRLINGDSVKTQKIVIP